MAKKQRKSRTPKPKRLIDSTTNPLAAVDDGLTQNHLRPSDDLIYESIMRGGGEPFGLPFARGISTLTDKIVKLFGQKSFFGFETIEKRPPKINKFTKYGSARFHGDYKKPRRRRPGETKKKKPGW